MTLTLIALTILLVLVNGFFVAAEFALVKVRPSRLGELARDGAPFSGTATWLADRMNNALSACQLGITMASLGLGWIGEPAIANLLRGVFVAVGVTSEAIQHATAFVIAFTVITAAHLVIGEQAPKIFAIREPEKMVRWCAAPLKGFYLATYPFLWALSGSTAMLLRRFNVDADSEHVASHSEEEIRTLLGTAHAQGEITRSERHLIDAVFAFDDTVCRQIMVPRVDAEFLDADAPIRAVFDQVQRSRHTRFPVCEGGMDRVLGVVHIKDLFGLDLDAAFDIRTILRAPRYIPETVKISRLLGHFQAARQHMAFVVDEYGTVVGIVTLEDVLERIVGSVEDEFDLDSPDVVPDGPGRFIVQAGAPLDVINRSLDLDLASREVDSIGGLVMEKLGRVLVVGDTVVLDGVRVEVMEVRDSRAMRLRLTTGDAPDRQDHSTQLEVGS